MSITENFVLVATFFWIVIITIIIFLRSYIMQRMVGRTQVVKKYEYCLLLGLIGCVARHAYSESYRRM